MNKRQEYERVIDHLDENKDGKISPSELRDCLRYVNNIDGIITETEAETVVLLMDSNGDGHLSVDDFIRLVEGAEDGEKVSDLREAFRMYENEGNCGVITPKSLKRMLSNLGEKRTVDECKHMIASYDVNGDGVLCFDEFRIMMS